MINLRYIFKIDMKMVLEIFTIGMPTFIRNVLGAVLVIIVNQLINQYAPNDPAIYISIYGVITRLITFLLLPGIGLVQGLQPIVGFNYGAKKIGRLMQSITFSLLLITVYFFTMSGITVLFSESFFVLFSRDADAFFIAEGGRAFRIIALGFGLIGFQIMMSSIYQAMGDAKRALFIALLRQFILFVPLAFIFSSLFGLDGIWLTFVVADALAGLISVAFYFHQVKQFKRELNVVPT
jgi:Na+-driven multidrug efflux pump